MSVATKFSSWQTRPPSDLKTFDEASPALVALKAFVLNMFGGLSLGIYGVRPVRGGTSLSSHAFGAAWDWSYRGVGRKKALEVMDWLILNSAELGVQAVHDYFGSRIWRANRVDQHGQLLPVLQRWKTQAADREGMGQTWGDWIHVEVHPDAWNDRRSVGLKLAPPASAATPVPAPAPQPAQAPMPATPPQRPVLQRGSEGDYVRIAQQVLVDRAGQVITVDGKFGPQTEAAVRNVQAFVHAEVTGVIDASFWHVIDTLLQPAA